MQPCTCIVGIQAKHKEKVLTLFGSGAEIPIKFLVWTTVLSNIMVLHYRLFRLGTWFNHFRGEDQRKRLGCFPFCRGPADNPAAKMITAFGAIILDGDGAGQEFMPLIVSRYGGQSANWPVALLSPLHTSCVLAFCRAWRMLFFPFQFYPWALAPAYDPEATEEEAEAALAKFIALPRGSKKLDPGLARRLSAEQ